MSDGMKFVMESPARFNFAINNASMVNKMPRFLIYNGMNAWGKGRELPKFAKTTFNKWWKENHKNDK
jgi:L-lactate dehydrogenase complex protein LldF